MDFEIKPILRSDTEKIYKFLTNHFYPDEPLNMSLKLAGPASVNDCACPKIIEQELSLMAVDKSDSDLIYGVTLNEIIKRKQGNDNWEELEQKSGNANYAKIMQFLRINNQRFIEKLEETLWKNTNAEETFEITIIAVNREYRGRHIATRLMQKAIDLAKSRNNRWMSIECSSAYSAKLARKFEFQPIYELPYDQYKDNNDEIVFRPPPPHASFTALAIDLNK